MTYPLLCKPFYSYTDVSLRHVISFYCSLFLDGPLLLRTTFLLFSNDASPGHIIHYAFLLTHTLTCPYDASSCLYLYISQACWVACSPRLDFLYPMVTEPIELVAELSILSVGYSSSLYPPSRTLVLTRHCSFALLELPSYSDVAKVEPLMLLLILRSYLRPSLDLSLSHRTPLYLPVLHTVHISLPKSGERPYCDVTSTKWEQNMCRGSMCDCLGNEVGREGD